MFVLGHKNPDTDAILSAMLYVQFLHASAREATAIRLGDMNNETLFCLDVLGWTAPELVTELPAGTHVILVDHNETSQSIDNISELTIAGIIDHHKCTITTSEPIEIIIRPIASTCSVIYGLRKASGYAISADVAKAMIMGILSDTLFFRSPTTTEYDRIITEELRLIAGIENMDAIEAMSLEMFAAKSDLGDIPVRKLITLDYKVFETANGKRFGVGSIETTSPEYALGRKDEILTDLIALKAEQELDLVFACVVDILNEHNTAIVATAADTAAIHDIFGVDTIDGLADLGNRISRKKQIAGPITEYFSL
jgi:manganese-dependent inorganic pyrophosphatase